VTTLHERIQALPADKRAELERRLREDAGRTGRTTAIPRRPDPDAPADLSFAQRQIWFLHQVRPPFTPPSVVELDGDLDTGALAAAFTTLVARHEALRTVIELHDGGPRQRALPPGPVPLPLVDVSDLGEAEQDRRIAEAVEQETYQPFHLTEDLMVRVRMFRRGPRRHLLLMTLNHMSIDGWSLGIIMRELGILYAAAAEGAPDPLPPLPIQYADYAIWQQRELSGEGLEKHLAYWREHLGSEPPRLELPIDRPRPDGPATAGASHVVALDGALAPRIKALAGQENATPFMVTLAAVAAVLHRSTGQTDLVLGSTSANRTRPETEALIGNFVNTQVLRTDVSGEPTFRELLARVRRTTLDAFEHQDLPFEKLVQELQPQRDASQSPIVQMVVNYDNTPRLKLERAGLSMRVRPVHMNVVHFDLTLTVEADAAGLSATWEYNTDIFEPETISRLAERWRRVLSQAVADPGLRIGDLDLLTDADRADLAALNATSAPVPTTPIHELIAEQARRTPDADAVTLAGATLSYAELDQRANQLAHLLRGHGVTPGDHVAICVDRSLELAVAILGVLKAGGAYVPIDPSYPAERLAYLLDDSAPRVVLLQAHLRDRAAACSGQVIALDTDWDDVSRYPITAPAPVAGPDDVAYVIYTSGSTGRPKGVQVDHRSLTGYAHAAIEAFDIVPQDRILQFASIGFDVLVEELFPTWLAGAAVVMVPERVLGGGAQLLQLVREERLTAFELPTSYWHEWAQTLAETGERVPEHLRLVIVGGERVLPDRLRDWQRTGVALTHVFGLTETTVTTTTYRFPAEPDDDVLQNLPIGKPLRNMTVHVLDDRERPVPIGVRGELYIGGIGVARGYLNRPELTAQRFVPDPFGAEPGGRLYRTGDLVRVRHGGDLEFIGRIDTQVKIRGHRIEPAEVEAALSEHPDVRDVVVVAREDTPGDRRLVAYVVPAADRQFDSGELRRFLEHRLPTPLIPSMFLSLDALPVTTHGKLDRAALPAPDGSRPEIAAGFVAPDNSAETTLAGIWADVIGIDRVGVHDNFFEIGGDSILSIQIVTRAQAAGVRLTPMDIFQHPTVAQLAAHAATARPAATAQTPQTGAFPLLPLQRWFFEQDMPVPEHWNMSAVLAIQAEYDDKLLQEAFDLLLQHHAGLRQRFTTGVDGTVTGEIADIGEQGFPLDVHDLSAVAGPERDVRFTEVATGLQAGLSLRDGPLARAAVVRFGRGEPDRLLVTAHHLVVDAVSLRILVAGFVAICEALRTGAPLPAAARTTAYAEWAQWMNRYAGSAELQQQTGHWAAVLGSPTAALPLDAPRGPGDNTSADADLVTATLDAVVTDALLRTAPRAYHTRINDLLLAGLALALTRWTGDAGHLIELEGHGRQDAPDVDLSATVGWFTTVYPVHLDGTGDGSPAAVIKRTKEQLRSVPAGGLGYLALRQRGALAPPAVEPEIAFSYFGQLDQVMDAGGPLTPAAESPGPTEDSRNPRPHLLEISGEIRDGQLRLGCRYGARLHRRENVQELLDMYAEELTAVIEHCRSVTEVEFTPSDFPNARLSQSALDMFLTQLSGDPGESR
jgi:amino acid adenylation domain-containing protein/non-ribosomal peptide synthase protein (TIGR01720 family)